jgi:hypothetical protein
MNVRNIVTALALAIGAFGFAAVGQAAKFIDVEIGVAPPAERVEVVPAPREGYVYERGHYVWNGSAHVCTDGQFIARREGHEWRPSVLERRGERWHYRGGHWDDED